jgi:hypothetical protein
MIFLAAMLNMKYGKMILVLQFVDGRKQSVSRKHRDIFDYRLPRL